MRITERKRDMFRIKNKALTLICTPKVSNFWGAYQVEVLPLILLRFELITLHKGYSFNSSCYNLNLSISADAYLYHFRYKWYNIMFSTDRKQGDIMNLIEFIEKNRIVAVDLETTGLNCRKDNIIEIGAVKIEGWKAMRTQKGGIVIEGANLTKRFTTFVSCPVKLSQSIVNLTGISDKDLENAPAIDVALKQLKEFIGNDIIVGHNIEFNYGFLSEHGRRYGIDFDNRRLDTVAIARTIYRDKIKNYSLSTLAAMLGIEYAPHRALNDAYAAAKLFTALALRDDAAHCNY